MLTQFRFQIASAAVCLAGCVVVTAVSIAYSDGKLIYTLDDPYIHLAIAEQILVGNYGVNPGEVASPASSVLYPVLVAVTMFLGAGTAGPLMIGVASMVLAVWITSGFVWRKAIGAATGANAVLSIALISLIILSMNGFALPMTGMEHPLHILMTVVVFTGLVEMVEHRRVPTYLAAAIVLCPLIRFEGLALSATALAAMAWQKHIRRAVWTALMLAGAMAAYGASMTAMGLPPLPSSVLSKSDAAAAAFDGQIAAIFQHATTNAALLMESRWGPFLAACVAILVALSAYAYTLGRHGVMVISLVSVTAIIAHLCFGRYGWFFRYEVYVVALSLLSLFYAASPILLNTGFVTIRNLGYILALLYVGQPYLEATALTPGASRNIYQQHFQMHRFATEYFPAPVAVHDLGWVAYDNENYVLDLAGLASEDIRVLRHGNADMASVIPHLITSNNIAYAMVYDRRVSWLVQSGGCWIAELSTSQVVAAASEVAFYLFETDRMDEMRRALSAFRSSLPAGASMEIYDCDTG